MSRPHLRATSPQWSRPKNGRMTGHTDAAKRLADTWPQWSRPKIGRMTRRVGEDRRPGAHLAAMEPAEDRPDDWPAACDCGEQFRAAMEPAEDRPDDEFRVPPLP